MSLDGVIEIIPADPESQFRLLNCKCGGDNAAYVHYEVDGGTAWRVECFDCGFTVDKGHRARHDAQVEWNQEVRDG